MYIFFLQIDIYQRAFSQVLEHRSGQHEPERIQHSRVRSKIGAHESARLRGRLCGDSAAQAHSKVRRLGLVLVGRPRRLLSQLPELVCQVAGRAAQPHQQHDNSHAAHGITGELARGGHSKSGRDERLAADLDAQLATGAHAKAAASAQAQSQLVHVRLL